MSFLLLLSRQGLKKGNLQFLLRENLLKISNVIQCLLSCSNLPKRETISWSFILFSSLRFMDRSRFYFKSSYSFCHFSDHLFVHLDAISISLLTSNRWRVRSRSRWKMRLLCIDISIWSERLGIEHVGPRLQSPSFMILMITKHMWLFVLIKFKWLSLF